MRFLYEHLKANPDALGWWTYLFVNAKDRVLVGTGGYKGKADESGMVEIGYAIVPAYRGRGLATEAARGFIDHAFLHAHIERVMLTRLQGETPQRGYWRGPERNMLERCLTLIMARYGIRA